MPHLRARDCDRPGTHGRAAMIDGYEDDGYACENDDPSLDRAGIVRPRPTRHGAYAPRGYAYTYTYDGGGEER